jgi:hypothetical protein
MHLTLSIEIAAGDGPETGAASSATGERDTEGIIRAFPQCQYKRRRGSLELRSSDLGILKEVVAFVEKQGVDCRIIQNDYWTSDEIARARWVDLTAKVGPVDTDDWEPLNRFPKMICTECGHYDDTRVPEPYKVLDAILTKKDEIFHALNGLIIANERVRNLVLGTCEDQVDCGEAQVTNQEGRATKRADVGRRFYWIRPKCAIGGFDGFKPGPPFCPRCGEALTSQTEEADEKVVINRVVVEHFGKKNWNIAVGGTLGHYRRPSGAVIQRRDVFVSGSLWAYLYNSGVKGLGVPEEGLFSARGDPPVEEKRRFGELMSGKDDKVARLKMWWQKK